MTRDTRMKRWKQPLVPTDPVSVEAMIECYRPAQGVQLSVVGPTGTGPVETVVLTFFLASSRAPTDAGSVESVTEGTLVALRDTPSFGAW